MILQKIKLTNFKNYPAASLEFSPRLNCFVGLNGMGKTNFLDAIHLICLAKSHTGLPDKNLVLHGENFYRIESEFEKSGETETVVVKFPLGGRKTIERNGVACERISDHIGHFPAVMIAPDDVALVQDGSEERRRFLDSTLSQISTEYLNNLLVYNNLIRQRNALLKQFFEEKKFDADLLESLDRQLPRPAQLIFEHRKKFVETLRPVFQEMYFLISGGQETVGLEFESDLEKGNFEDLLKSNLEKDRMLQRTSSGIHRDDLNLSVSDFPARKFASQGQLKSFLLALRLGQYQILREEKGDLPLLLLDDIFDKLDEKRVGQLISLLLEKDFGQIFITDTQRNRIENIVSKLTDGYRIFEVKLGEII